jgi:UPF0271 protein
VNQLEALILDTSAFIQGYSTDDTKIQLFTVPLVKNEVKNNIAQIRIQSAESSGKLLIIEPKTEFLSKINTMVHNLGESDSLSSTDRSILALALQLSSDGFETTIISDDYSVQNIADKISIKYQSLGVKRIKKQIIWIFYCPGCRRRFNEPQKDSICPICGTPIKRKPR